MCHKISMKEPNIRMQAGQTDQALADAHQTGGTLRVLLGYRHSQDDTPGKMTLNYSKSLNIHTHMEIEAITLLTSAILCLKFPLPCSAHNNESKIPLTLQPPLYQ